MKKWESVLSDSQNRFGRGTRIRTLGTWFWRPLLYQLSYTPTRYVFRWIPRKAIHRWSTKPPKKKKWRRRWDSNPCTGYSRSNGLATRPLQPTWVLLRVYMAEGVGFEPTRPFGQTVFKTASLWPLRYPSNMKLYNYTKRRVIYFLSLKNGDPSEIRTRDTLIKSQVLYHLS